MHTAYWDSKYPRLVTKDMIRSLSKEDPFRLEMIGDLSCDIEGSIEITHKTTSRQNPIFTYNPKNKLDPIFGQDTNTDYVQSYLTYTEFRLSIRATGEMQLKALHQDLMSHPLVKLVL